MTKENGPIAAWMQKRHLKGVTSIEEANHAWEGWGEKEFIKRLRDKNTIGLVSTISDVVGAFTIYELREKEILILKFETAKELVSTRTAHVLLNALKKKGAKYKKNVVVVFPEHREDIPKYQFFAKEGFKSALKKNFSSETEPEVRDDYVFTWKYSDFEDLGTDEDSDRV